MLAYLFLSPDAPKTNEANQAAAALRELNAQVVAVVQETATGSMQKVLEDPTTYRLTAEDFQKSRENLDGPPQLEWKEIKKRIENANKIISLLGNLDGAELDAKMKAENITLKTLDTTYVQIVECFNYFQHYKLLNDKGDASTSVEKDDFVSNAKWQNKMGVLMEKLHAIITKIKTHRAQKEINDAKAGGVVTDYTKIAENPKLAEVIDKLHITFKKDEDGLIGVYVNGEYTNFDIQTPKTLRYEILSGEENEVVFIKYKKNNSVYYRKFISKDGAVLSFSRRDNKTEWEKRKQTFKNPAKKEVSMSH